MPVSFTPVTDIDPNVWYQLSETRVDSYKDTRFGLNLQVTNISSGELKVLGNNGHAWQFQPSSNSDAKGRYFLRCGVTGVNKQLAVCYHEDEASEGKTRPCMRPSDGSDAQQWDIASWDDVDEERNGTQFRLINAHNGSEYWLDVHRGNPLFMNDVTDTDIPQPAQRWLFSSMSKVDDGGYSTMFTNIPQTESPSTTTQDSGTTSTSTSEPTSDPPSNSDGLPAGTAAGIGVGVGLGVVLLAGLAFFFWRRRRRQAGAATATTPGSPHPPSYGPVEAASKPAYSPYSQLQTPSPRPTTAEMPGDLGVAHELDSGYQR